MSTIRLRRTKESTAIEIAAAVMLMASWIIFALKLDEFERPTNKLIFASITTTVTTAMLVMAYFPSNRWVNSFEATTPRQLVFVGRIMRIIAIEFAALFLLTQISLFLPSVDIIPDFIRTHTLTVVLTVTVVWGTNKLEKMKKEDRKDKTGIGETKSKK